MTTLSTGEFYSEAEIRCPRCGDEESACDHDLNEDGIQEVECPSCGHTYEVNVYVSVRYTSPPMNEGSGL